MERDNNQTEQKGPEEYSDDHWDKECARLDKEEETGEENQSKKKYTRRNKLLQEPFPIVENKEGGFPFFVDRLKSPRKIVAPMVNQSELPFRLLCRKYGADLCYTPMFHSKLFATDKNYRSRYFTTCPEDRPLVVQFCANDPVWLVRAAKFVEDDCDAVDINFGCPQRIAKVGNYGSFLMESPETVHKLVKAVHDHIKVPVFAKIRIFHDYEQTLAYAKMIESAGCQLLTVHGRTREMKGASVGLADWEVIKKLKQELKIPVISNGNIREYEDYERCMEETKVDGVMSAEGILKNPSLFTPTKDQPDPYKMALEYLDLCKIHPTQMIWVRNHLFKIFEPFILQHEDIKLSIFKTTDVDSCAQFVRALQNYTKTGDMSQFKRLSDFMTKEGKVRLGNYKYKTGGPKVKYNENEDTLADISDMESLTFND